MYIVRIVCECLRSWNLCIDTSENHGGSCVYISLHLGHLVVIQLVIMKSMEENFYGINI
jgi:hypothetical protein